MGLYHVSMAFDFVEPNLRASPSKTKFVVEPQVKVAEAPPIFTEALDPNAENPPLPRLPLFVNQFTVVAPVPRPRVKSADVPVPFEPPLISRTPPRNKIDWPDVFVSDPFALTLTRRTPPLMYI